MAAISVDTDEGDTPYETEDACDDFGQDSLVAAESDVLAMMLIPIYMPV